MNRSNKMRMRFRAAFAASLAAAMLLAACDSTDFDADTTAPVATESMTALQVSRFASAQKGDKGDANKKIEALAKALAETIADPELAQYVHARAIERFDGETNVLWQHLDNPSHDKAPNAVKRANGLSTLIAQR